ncbi:MAG: class I SAM-dependent methyltransferase [Candidatus Thorarchaeota archaeon]
MGKIKAWFTLITQMGPVASIGKKFETLNRFFVLDTLKSEGFFEFIETPKTYNEILDHFGYKDIPYTKELLNLLKDDKAKIVFFSKEKNTFQKNPQAKLPTLQDLLTIRDFERIYNASKVPQKFAKAIPNRMLGVSKNFIEDLGEPGPSLFDYDEALTHKLYTALRNSNFSFINKKRLLKKKILDIGCGSGRETAEIWIKLKGNTHIVATDPVPSFIETARSQFRTILEETIQKLAKNKILPDLTEENEPEFMVMRAENLEFPDESFDAVFLQQILHWTSDPRKAILEIGRVLKSGGLFFGCQGTLPLSTPFMDIMIRAHENVNGFFTLPNFKKWLEEAEFVNFKRATPAGIFKTIKK